MALSLSSFFSIHCMTLYLLTWPLDTWVASCDVQGQLVAGLTYIASGMAIVLTKGVTERKRKRRKSQLVWMMGQERNRREGKEEKESSAATPPTLISESSKTKWVMNGTKPWLVVSIERRKATFRWLTNLSFSFPSYEWRRGQKKFIAKRNLFQWQNYIRRPLFDAVVQSSLV